MLLTTRSRKVTALLAARDKIIEENKAMTKRQQNPHNPLSEALADGAWAGEPCFILGGGPSLTGFDFGRLRGRGRVIAINRAFEFAPFADMLFFMDWKFYKFCHANEGRKRVWDEFQGHKAFLNLMGRRVDNAHSIRSLGRHGVSTSIGKGLHHGNNSGFGALQIALALGTRPIYLLGYDMGSDDMGGYPLEQPKEWRSHFHDGYGQKARPAVARSFVRDFIAVEKKLKSYPYIYNLNPRSGLRIFRFSTIDEVLGDRQTRQGVGDDGGAVREAELLPAPA